MKIERQPFWVRSMLDVFAVLLLGLAVVLGAVAWVVLKLVRLGLRWLRRWRADSADKKRL